MPWIVRGLRHGVQTTRYPRRADDYGASYRAGLEVHGTGGWPSGEEDPATLCPTGAIACSTDVVRVDLGRCVLCGRCVERWPERFRFSSDAEVARLGRATLVVPELEETDEALQAAKAELARRTRRLRRSVHVRHVDAGSDGSEEWEVAALSNPVYDVQRLGIFFTASPRHADVLLVTGAGVVGMEDALRSTFEATPDPKIVVAAGTDAISGGLLRALPGGAEGLGRVVNVDVFVPGSPPSPFSLLHGILLGVGLLGSTDRGRP